MDSRDQAVAVPPRIDLAAWRAGFDDVFARVAGRFAQAPSRKRARAYLLGLLSQARAEERVDDRGVRRGCRRRTGCSGC